MSTAAGQPAEAAPSRGGKKLPILVASVLALAGSGVVAWRKLAAKPHEGAAPEPKPVVREPGVVELEPFVQSLADPTGDRFLRLNLRLVLDQRAIAERAATGLAQAKLRDRVLAVLARKRAAQLATLEGKELLREEIRQAAAALMDEAPFHLPATDPAPAHVRDVLFLEFLLQ